jgi:Uncharacterised nucleotidyltransferase
MSTGLRTERLEDDLLLRCARTSRDLEDEDRIKVLLQQGIDWDYLLRLAAKHLMTPLLYWHLRTLSPQYVPTNVSQQLRHYFQSNSLRNLSMMGELLKLLRAFEERGITAVPYKGPVLAACIYGNLALREFIDIDILVRKQDIIRVRMLLTSLGYRQEVLLNQSQEAAFLRSQQEYVFSRNGGSIIEIHWAVTPRNYSFPLDPEDLWERLQEVRLGGDIVPTLSPEDLLLFLCVHGSKHFWHRLAWIGDVAELIRAQKGMDWERLVGRAESLGSRRMLLLGLFLANDLLAARLPETILQMVRADLKVEALARQVQGWLFEEVDSPPGILARGQIDGSRFHPFRIRMRERWRDKVRYCAYTALVPSVEDWQYLPLPKPLYPLYYVVRPFRLVGSYGPRLLEHMLR